MKYVEILQLLGRDFYEACRGRGDRARNLKLPFVSGNVSFYNESVKTTVPPTPELFGIGIVDDIRKCVTSDFKGRENPVYLIGGPTNKEMGGSEYYNILKIEEGVVPQVQIKLLKNCMNGLIKAMNESIIISCHDVSEGGIAVCLSEMIIGGDIGAEVNISKINSNLRDDFTLFSESNTRWIAEIKKDKSDIFKKILKKHDTPFIKIGNTKSNKLIIKNGKKELINLDIIKLHDSWKNTIFNIIC